MIVVHLLFMLGSATIRRVLPVLLMRLPSAGDERGSGDEWMYDASYSFIGRGVVLTTLRRCGLAARTNQDHRHAFRASIDSVLRHPGTAGRVADIRKVYCLLW
jgi:hypothetical protein